MFIIPATEEFLLQTRENNKLTLRKAKLSKHFLKNRDGFIKASGKELLWISKEELNISNELKNIKFDQDHDLLSFIDNKLFDVIKKDSGLIVLGIIFLRDFLKKKIEAFNSINNLTKKIELDIPNNKSLVSKLITIGSFALNNTIEFSYIFAYSECNPTVAEKVLVIFLFNSTVSNYLKLVEFDCFEH